jgi:hypothetical protein
MELPPKILRIAVCGVTAALMGIVAENTSTGIIFYALLLIKIELEDIVEALKP